MTIQNPVGGAPEDPYERYKKYRIEEEGRESKKKFGDDEPPKKKLPPGSFFFVLLHKVLDYFIRLGGGETKSEKEVREDLRELREVFEIMEREDRSQDIEFLNSLSRVWHSVLEQSLRLRRIDPFSTRFREFMKKIEHYPEGEMHTFGYYLREYTGEKWLPFPYMELIQRIHEEYQSNPSGSALSLWIQELDELIAIEYYH